MLFALRYRFLFPVTNLFLKRLDRLEKMRVCAGVRPCPTTADPAVRPERGNRLLDDGNFEQSRIMMTIPMLSAWQDGVFLWEAVAKYSNEGLWNEFVTLSEELN
jgi:hypothetical protein